MTAKTPTRKRLPLMTDEVRQMLDLRHSAEQRGNFSPLGRLAWMQTEHGTIQFPVVNGEGCGPDLAQRCDTTTGPDPNALLVLGQWEGLPPLRVNTSKPCPKCRHACDVCDGSGKKLCELCGGQTWIPGNWLPCAGPNCLKETGKFRGECVTCGGSGQIREQNPCAMCDGSAKMTCSRCAGSGKYSTGRINGAVDWDVSPKCKFCYGSTFVGEWQRQDEKRFTNAMLLYKAPKAEGARRGDVDFLLGRRKAYRVLGPILEFAIRDPHSLRARIFDVSPDSAGDLLVLLVPRSKVQRPQKAYLVGGVVRERGVRMAVGA